MLDALISPWSCIGAVAGLLAAMLIHWVFPDADVVQAGAWLVGIGWFAGMVWDWIGEGSARRD